MSSVEFLGAGLIVGFFAGYLDASRVALRAIERKLREPQDYQEAGHGQAKPAAVREAACPVCGSTSRNCRGRMTSACMPAIAAVRENDKEGTGFADCRECGGAGQVAVGYVGCESCASRRLP